MRTKFAVAAAGLLALIASTMGMAAAPVPPDRLAAFLDRTFKTEMKQAHIAGATVAIVQGGKVVALRGYGLAGVSPDRAVDPSRTLFGIASTSKILTWTLLLRAAEARRIDLHRPVNDYLPSDLQVPTQGFSKPILFVDLLRHTTGFEDRDVKFGSPAFFGGHQPSLAEYLRLARPDREREPGDTPNYSNYAPNLAAMVALRGSGAPDYPSLVERDILKPLGMASTTFREPHGPDARLPAPMPAEMAARRTQNLVWNGHQYHARGYEFMMDGPASAVSTTAADMARLMLAQLDGGSLGTARIYGPETAKAFRTPLLGGAQSNRWAHGLMMVALPGGYTGYGHDGGTTTTSAALIVVPDLDLGVFAAVNSPEGQLVWTLADRLVREFYAKDSASHDRPRAGSPALVREAARYEGTYVTERRPYAGLAKFVLYDPIQVSVDDRGYLHAASGGRDRRWVPAGPPGAFVDAEGEDVLAFAFGSDGRAVSWRDPLATRTFQRVSPLLAMPLLMGLAVLTAITTLALMVAGIWRYARRYRALPRPAALKRFDRVELALAIAFLVAIGCAVFASVFADQASGIPFPPMALRAFALTMCLMGVGALLLLVLTPSLWRTDVARWRKAVRTAAILPFALLAVRLGAVGGSAFWS